MVVFFFMTQCFHPLSYYRRFWLLWGNRQDLAVDKESGQAEALMSQYNLKSIIIIGQFLGIGQL